MIAVVKHPQNVGVHILTGRILEFEKNRPGAFSGVGDIKMLLVFIFLPVQIKFVYQLLEH